MALTERYWEQIPLDKMDNEQWEALCDGCGKCCLHKFIDDDGADEMASTEQLNEGEELLYTDIVCRYMNDKTCSCTQYAKRQVLVPDCVKLTKDNLKDLFYMPNSCTYRRLYEGRGMPSWHPLLHKGKKTAMHKAGMSARGKTIKDDQIDLDDFEDRIVTWPLRDID